MINQVEYWPAGCYRRWRAGPEEAGLHLGGFGSGALLVGQDGDGLRELEEYFAVDVALAGAVAARRRTGRPFARNKTAPVASPINRSSFPVLYQFFFRILFNQYINNSQTKLVINLIKSVAVSNLNPKLNSMGSSDRSVMNPMAWNWTADRIF